MIRGLLVVLLVAQVAVMLWCLDKLMEWFCLRGDGSGEDLQPRTARTARTVLGDGSGGRGILENLDRSELDALMKEAFAPAGKKELTGMVAGRFLKGFGWSEEQIQKLELCEDRGSVDDNLYFVSNAEAGRTEPAKFGQEHGCKEEG